MPLFLAGYEEKQYLYGIYNATTAKKSEQFSDKNSILMPQQKRTKNSPKKKLTKETPKDKGANQKKKKKKKKKKKLRIRNIVRSQ